MPVNNALELTNFAGTDACDPLLSFVPKRKRRASYPSPLLLRRRGFGQSLQLSAALDGQ
jgi:hypothetical protein